MQRPTGTQSSFLKKHKKSTIAGSCLMTGTYYPHDSRRATIN